MLNDDETNSAVAKYKKLSAGRHKSNTTPKEWEAIRQSVEFKRQNPWCTRDEVTSTVKALLTPDEIEEAIEEMDFALSNFSYEHAQLVLMEHRWLANEYAPVTSDLMPGAPFVAIAITEADKTTAKLFLKCDADLTLKGPHGKTIKGYVKSREDYDSFERNERLSWMTEATSTTSYTP